MYSSRLLTASCLLFALGACDSKTKSLLDPDLQAKIETVTNCIPPQMEKLNEILDVADLWRLQNVNNPPDPSELMWSEDGTTITYTITLPTFTINGTIQFFDPTGGPVALGTMILGQPSLSLAIDAAATELRDRTPGTSRPYIVGDFTVSGANVSSAGVTSSPAALTGFIAGSANDNELEEVRTTTDTSTATSGPPPVQDVMVTTTGNETCVFTFRIDSLLTDESPMQEYPIGTITWSLENQTEGVTVNGTLNFDGSVIAVLDVSGVGKFNINIETRDVSAQ